MATLRDYIIDNKPAYFETTDFQDVSNFKEWLLREREDLHNDANSHVYQFFYAIVQEMTQFRFHAEEYYRKNDFIAKSKRRELPIPYDKIKSQYFDKQQEPPETVVSRIAQNQIHIIDAILLKIRKILRRERELTRISNVQQLDSQCLAWLTRQPGTTAAEKAGMKQRLMAVVRKENYDILENRVLKAVLKLCSSYCQRYLRQYDKEPFQDSLRIKAVRRLYSTAQFGLKQDVMQAITPVHGIPVPNYVLQHDQQYSQVWQMYLDLLRQTSLMENAWRNRHRLLLQYFLFCFGNVLQVKYKGNILFNSQFWVSVDKKNNGLFIQNSSFRKLFVSDNIVGSFSSREECVPGFSGSAEFRYGEKRHIISLVYLPADVKLNGLRVLPEKNHTSFIFHEAQDEEYKGDADIVLIKKESGLFYQLNDWFCKFMGGL